MSIPPTIDEDGQSDRTETLLLVVGRDSPRLRAVGADDPDVFRFKRLPFVAVNADHAVLDERLPEVVGSLVVGPSTYALLWSVNRILLEADALARTWAPNGNRWAVEWDGENGDDGYPLSVPDEPPRRVPSFIAGVAEGVPVLEPIMRWTRVAHPAVLNLSLQSGALNTDDRKALAVATRTASQQMPVVVAAGNWGRGRRSRLSPLATFPWTISVTAMADKDATKLHPCSSVGAPGAPGRPAVGPDLAAYGEDSFERGTFGTSFAVPRVSRQIVAFTAFALELAEGESRLRKGDVTGVPLPMDFAIDVGFEGSVAKPSEPFAMLPFCGVDIVALDATRAAITADGLDIQLDFGVRCVERMLYASARPVAGYGTHEVGRGVVSDETTQSYLSAFTGEDLLETCCPDAPATAAVRERLRHIVISVPSEIPQLQHRALSSMLRYALELTTARIRATMRNPAATPGVHAYRVEPSNYRWPPELEPEDRRVASQSRGNSPAPSSPPSLCCRT